MQFPISIMIVIDCFFFGFYLAYYSLLIKAGHHFFLGTSVYFYSKHLTILCVFGSVFCGKLEKLQVPKKRCKF